MDDANVIKIGYCITMMTIYSFKRFDRTEFSRPGQLSQDPLSSTLYSVGELNIVFVLNSIMHSASSAERLINTLQIKL